MGTRKKTMKNLSMFQNADLPLHKGVKALMKREIKAVKRFPQEIRGIIKLALQYKKPTPFEYKGVEFYEVGHNSSHVFCLGYKDSTYYKLTIDCDYVDCDCDCDCNCDDVNYCMKEIPPDDWGCIGHF